MFGDVILKLFIDLVAISKIGPFESKKIPSLGGVVAKKEKKVYISTVKLCGFI